MQQLINQAWFAIVIPGLLGFGLGSLCIRQLEFYGWSIFVGLPVVITALSAFCTAYRRKIGFGSAYGRAFASLLLTGACILAFKIDGLLCLLMALPIGALLGLVGVLLGFGIAALERSRRTGAGVLALLLSPPVLVAFDAGHAGPPRVRRVSTVVEVRAPIARAWETVIAFPRIAAPPTGLFRWGLAYPIEATIHGEGVGAIRYCRFSTGDFIEPITDWSPPDRLAFDVTASPAPMEELSPHGNIDVPHLDGHFVSQRGGFRLSEQGDVVRVEGTTWYTHSLGPDWYWGPITDHLIHQIHLRVLRHIALVAAGAAD